MPPESSSSTALGTSAAAEAAGKGDGSKSQRRGRRGRRRLVPRAAFRALARALADDLSRAKGAPHQWTDKALATLLEASEAYVASVFEDAGLCARLVDATRSTVRPRQMRLAIRLRQRDAGPPGSTTA